MHTIDKKNDETLEPWCVVCEWAPRPKLHIFIYQTGRAEGSPVYFYQNHLTCPYQMASTKQITITKRIPFHTNCKLCVDYKFSALSLAASALERRQEEPARKNTCPTYSNMYREYSKILYAPHECTGQINTVFAVIVKNEFLCITSTSTPHTRQ